MVFVHVCLEMLPSPDFYRWNMDDVALLALPDICYLYIWRSTSRWRFKVFGLEFLIISGVVAWDCRENFPWLSERWESYWIEICATIQAETSSAVFSVERFFCMHFLSCPTSVSVGWWFCSPFPSFYIYTGHHWRESKQIATSKYLSFFC